MQPLRSRWKVAFSLFWGEKRYFLLHYISGPQISIQIRCSGILIFMMYIRIWTTMVLKSILTISTKCSIRANCIQRQWFVGIRSTLDIRMKTHWFNLQRTFKALQKGCRLMHSIGNKGQGRSSFTAGPHSANVFSSSVFPMRWEERWSPWLTTLIIFHTNRRSIFAQMMCLQPCACVKWICCQLETSSAVPVCM